MNKDVEEHINNLSSSDDKVRLNALQTVLTLSDQKVDWVYDVWDDLVIKLDDENSYQRSIAIMVLCNLLKSDTENRLEGCLDRLLTHTRDEKFITSRQCLQNIWKAAVTNGRTHAIVLDHLEKQFIECADENHSNLIRLDIIQSTVLVYKIMLDESVISRARELIKVEQEEKYRKKYEAIVNQK